MLMHLMGISLMSHNQEEEFFEEPVDDAYAEMITPESLEQAAVIIEQNAKEAAKTRESLDQLLKGVRLTPPPGYVPSLFALQFVNFIKLVNGTDGEEHQTPIIHYFLLDGFASEHDRIALMVFRGAAKTTLFEYLILYLARFGELPGIGKLNSAIYMSDTIDNGVVNMQKNLKHRWENSRFLQAQIPKAQFFKVSWEFTNVDGKPFVVKGFGAASGFRGFKIFGSRPKLALLDDLISDAMAESDIEMRKVENVIKRGVQPALNPQHQKIIWAGTPFNERDPLCKAVVSGAWLAFMFPVCEEFPCKEKDFVGAWDDRFTYKYIKRQYEIAVAGGDTTEFFRELMLKTVSDEERLLNTNTDIRWYQQELVDNYQGEKTIVMTTDLSFSGNSKSDEAIFDIWELRPNEDIYWIDGESTHPDVNQVIDLLFGFVEKYSIVDVGIEISGQQVALIRLLQTEMLKRNIFFNLAGERGKPKDQKGIRPVSNKLVRFKVVVPLFQRRKILFPANRRNDALIQAKIHQLDSVTRTGIQSRKDDALDSMSMLGLMELNYPSAATVREDPREMQLNPAVWGKPLIASVEEDYLDNYLV